MSTPKSRNLLKSLVARDREMVKLLVDRLGGNGMRADLEKVHGRVQELESEIDVLSFQDAADKEHQAFRALERHRHGKIFSDQLGAYVRKRNKLLETGDDSAFDLLSVFEENQRRLLEAAGPFSRLESEIDVLSFAGAIVTNYERLL